MGPKKDAKGGKKGGGGDAQNGGELGPEEKAKLYMLACQSLQVQLGDELGLRYRYRYTIGLIYILLDFFVYCFCFCCGFFFFSIFIHVLLPQFAMETSRSRF